MRTMRTITILLALGILAGTLSAALAGSVGEGFMSSLAPRKLTDAFQVALPAIPQNLRDAELGAPATIIENKFVYLPQLSPEQNQTAFQLAFGDPRVQRATADREFTASIQPLLNVTDIDVNGTPTFEIIGATIELQMADGAKAYLAIVSFQPPTVADFITIVVRPPIPEPSPTSPTDEQIQQAIGIALEDPRVQEFIDGHSYRTEAFVIGVVVGPEVRSDQPTATTVGVAIYLDTGEIGQALVDLEQRIVIDFVVLSMPEPVPELSEEQKALALSIAFNDTRVKDFVSGHEYRVLVYAVPPSGETPGVDPASPVPRGETKATTASAALVAAVEIYRDDGAVASVHIDLSTETVIAFEAWTVTPQPWLDEEQARMAIDLALNDTRVMSQVNGTEYKIDVVPTYQSTPDSDRQTIVGAIVYFYFPTGDILAVTVDFATMQVTDVTQLSHSEPPVTPEPLPISTDVPPLVREG